MTFPARLLRAALATAGLTALTACDAADLFMDEGLQEYEDREAAYYALREAAPDAMLDPADLPASGSATYEGAAMLNATADGALGDLDMTVGFADGSVGGTVTNLISGEGDEIGGTLVLSGGSIDRTPDSGEAALRADLDGALEAPNGDDVVVDGVLMGDFYGSDYGYVMGSIEGQTCTNGVCDGGDGEGDLGEFVARR